MHPDFAVAAAHQHRRELEQEAASYRLARRVRRERRWWRGGSAEATSEHSAEAGLENEQPEDEPEATRPADPVHAGW